MWATLRPGIVGAVYAALVLACSVYLLPAAAQESTRAPAGSAASQRSVESLLRGDHAAAVKYAEEALAANRKQYGDEGRASLDSLAYLANLYAVVGRRSEAISMAENASRTMQRVFGNADLGTLQSRVLLANVYGQADRIADGIKVLENDLGIARAKFGDLHEMTADILGSLGPLYLTAGRSASAVQVLSRAISIRRQRPGYLRQIATQMNLLRLAGAYVDLGNVQNALSTVETLLYVLRETGDTSSYVYLQSLNMLAVVYRSLGRFDDAIALRENVVNQYRSRLGAAHPETIRTMLSLGTLYIEAEHTEKAVAVLESAFAIAEKTLPETSLESLLIRKALGRAYQLAGKTKLALSHLQQVVRLAQGEGERSPLLLDAKLNLASSLQANGQGPLAAPLMVDVVRVLRETRGLAHPFTLDALLRLAMLYSHLDDRTKALATLESYITGVEALRASRDLSPDDRQAQFAKYVTGYKLHAILVGRTDPLRAYELAELSKGRTLVDLLTRRRAIQAGVLPPGEAAKFAELEAGITAIQNRIGDAESQPDLKRSLEYERNQLQSRLESLRRSLMMTHKKFAELNEVRLVSLDDAMKLLPADSAYVSFLNVEDVVMAMTLTRKHGLRWFVIGEVDNLQGRIERLRESLARGAGQSPATLALAQDLSRRLLDPMAEVLGDAQQWIIAPDGPLALLPFEVLPFQGRRVIEGRRVSYVQSLSVFALMGEREQAYRSLPQRKELLAMGGPPYSRQFARPITPTQASPVDVAVRGIGMVKPGSEVKHSFDRLGMKWDDLPGAKREIESVAAIFRGLEPVVLIGEDATETNLRKLDQQGELKHFRYILFSAHGYLSMTSPALSALVLGRTGDEEANDGYVTAAEWPAFDMRSDLVVLSACETGLGKLIEGEGIMGLPYALYVAGNRNTLLTLWPVADESAAEFMTRFFTKLREGQSQINALASTKREFLSHPRFSDPLHWAAFVLYGN